MLKVMSMALQAFLFLVPGFVTAGFLFSAERYTGVQLHPSVLQFIASWISNPGAGSRYRKTRHQILTNTGKYSIWNDFPGRFIFSMDVDGPNFTPRISS